MYPGWEIWKDGWLGFFWTLSGGSGRGFDQKFWNSPWLRESEEFLVGKSEGEALKGADRDVVRRSEIGCHSVKRTDPGLVNVWIGC